jgi:hypothetical protein
MIVGVANNISTPNENNTSIVEDSSGVTTNVNVNNYEAKKHQVAQLQTTLLKIGVVQAIEDL